MPNGPERRLNLRQLQIFLGVAEAGSMAKAARILAISQPAVSRAISELEQVLGVALLDRQAQGVVPTKYGQVLITRGRAVFDELKHGVEDIRWLAEPGLGELTIGATPTSAEGLVSLVIDSLARQHPTAAFQVLTEGALAQQDMLRQRRIELGIARMSALPTEADMEVEVLLEEPLAVVVGLENPLARRRKIGLGELLGEPWTWTTPGTIFDRLVVDAFKASGLEPPTPSVRTNSGSLRIRLAAQGRFLAVVPAAILRFRDQQTMIKTLPVELPGTGGKISILTLRNRTLSPLAALFISAARQLARPGAGSTRDGGS